ncbi:conserved Plasmodium protein, unknown function [Plasmodium ovale]|uniref:Uncharacterized protein n=1 Tax=Plasmodium ovale TaxID=36330 RepID=A0A1C3KUA6_PLAOA|nr:conserved Plasmodium protein, unknown function [Plasmodium ovale]
MFTKRKVVKKNIKKNLQGDFPCDDSANVLPNVGEGTGGMKETVFQKKCTQGVADTQESISPTESCQPPSEHVQGTQDGPARVAAMAATAVATAVATTETAAAAFQEKREKKKKLSYAERRREEESSRVNKMNTSFYIYSDNDSDGYVTLKKKKKPFLKSAKGMEMGRETPTSAIKDEASAVQNDFGKGKGNLLNQENIRRKRRMNLHPSKSYGASSGPRVGKGDHNDTSGDDWNSSHSSGCSNRPSSSCSSRQSSSCSSRQSSSCSNRPSNSVSREADQPPEEHVTIQLEDDSDGVENEEERKIIEKIKLKRNILRKKMEINTRGNLVSGEDEDEEEGIIPLSRLEKMESVCIDTPDYCFKEDDYECDDLYNYETVGEMKNRLLIRKNRNASVTNLYQGLTNAEEEEIKHFPQTEQNAHPTFLVHTSSSPREEDMIQQIVDRRAIEEMSRQRVKEGSLFDSDEDEYDLSNVFKGEIKHYEEKKGKGEDVQNEMEIKREIREDDKGGASCQSTTDFGNDNQYSHDNILLVDNIKYVFEDKAVCNLQILNMHNYINTLFRDYRYKMEEMKKAKIGEEENKKKYIKHKNICKCKKIEVITCNVFSQYVTILMSLLEEKSKCIDDALNVLHKMEFTFSLIYTNFKLYMYKEYYERYKLSFINEYIFNVKYYKNRKEKMKRQHLYSLIRDNLFTDSRFVSTVTLFYENATKQISDCNQFDNPLLHYMIDGFSSHYSTDSDSSSGERKYNSGKDPLVAKRKYFNTLKMKNLKSNFLTGIKNIFADVNVYFLNLKKAIKYFYMLKCYNYDFYKKNNCIECFDDVFFFFVKYELLFWDPLYQFFLKKKKKKMVTRHICEREMVRTPSVERYWRHDHVGMDGGLLHIYGEMKKKRQSSTCQTGEVGIEEGSAGGSADGSADGSEEGSEEGSADGSEEGSGSNLSVDSSPVLDEQNLQVKGEHESKTGRLPISSPDSPPFPSCPLLKSDDFRKKKYLHRGKSFHNNPCVGSFEWYKFLNELVVIYDSTSEKEILQRVYHRILSSRVHEFIEVWNPLSLKQSFSLYIIISDYTSYSQERETLICKLEEKINSYVTTFLECYKNVSNPKKKNLFLTRSLKLLMCIKNIVFFLKEKSLFDIVKNIFCNFVVQNCDYSNKFHNLVMSSVIRILQSLNIPNEDNFNKDLETIQGQISTRLKAGDVSFDSVKIENECATYTHK